MTSDFASFTAVGSSSTLPCAAGDSIQATLADLALTVDGLTVGGAATGRAGRGVHHAASPSQLSSTASITMSL